MILMYNYAIKYVVTCNYLVKFQSHLKTDVTTKRQQEI